MQPSHSFVEVIASFYRHPLHFINLHRLIRIVFKEFQHKEKIPCWALGNHGMEVPCPIEKGNNKTDTMAATNNFSSDAAALQSLERLVICEVDEMHIASQD